jgi:hypothetical protein
MSKTTMFTITEQHLKLSRQMYVSWNYCEFGAPEIDPKRPYGNKDVIGDMIEILGLDFTPDKEYGEYPEEIAERLTQIHEEMGTVLQIFLCTGQIRTGAYKKIDPYSDRSWELARDG